MQNDIEVYVGSVQGYASSQELIKLIRDGILLRPNIVISYSGINDATGIGVIDKHPMITRDVEYELEKVGISFGFGMENVLLPSKVWLNNMKMMRGICEELGIKFVGILEPFPFYSNRRNKEKSLREAFFTSNEQRRIIAFYNSARKDIKTERNLFDYSELFAKSDIESYDYIHYRTDGNEVIAKKVFHSIKRYL